MHSIELVDLTDHIAKVVADSGLREGWVDLWCRHTSRELLVNENETGLRADVATLCGELVRVIRAERDCSLREAIDATVTMHNAVMREFEEREDHLLTDGPVQVRRWLAGLRDWMGGNLLFHLTSPRYLGTP